MATANFPSNPVLNQTYTNESRSWTWNGRFWQATSTTVGYSGSIGYTGSSGYAGSTGFVGSAGYIGSSGYAGSTGFVGSAGYIGSKGESSFTFAATAPSNPAVGDRWYDIVDGAELVWTNDGDSTQWVEVAASGFVGQTGYVGSNGYTGSRGTDGVLGYTGSQGAQLYVINNPGGGFSYTVDGFAGTYPTLTVVRGELVYFNLQNISIGHPLAFRLASGNTSAVPGMTDNNASTGNYATSTLVVYRVPYDAPSQIVYQCVYHSSMIGYINVRDQTGYTGSTGLVSRSTATVTTASVANAASTTASITGFRGYNLYKVYSSHAAWIRFYTNVAARTTDSSRTQGTDPTPDVGIVTEVITSAAGQTVTLAPAVLGFNDENPVTTAIPIAVTNLSGSAVAITVTITLVQTEA